MYFSDFSGQDSTKTQLLDLFKSERVPHALLLNGEEGCGHLQLALSFYSLFLLLLCFIIFPYSVVLIQPIYFDFNTNIIL